MLFQRHRRCCGRASISHVAENGNNLRQSEIEDFGVPPLGHKDVRRLYVSVDDARRVRSIERVGHLDPKQQYCLDF